MRSSRRLTRSSRLPGVSLRVGAKPVFVEVDPETCGAARRRSGSHHAPDKGDHSGPPVRPDGRHRSADGARRRDSDRRGCRPGDRCDSPRPARPAAIGPSAASLSSRARTWARSATPAWSRPTTMPGARDAAVAQPTAPAKYLPHMIGRNFRMDALQAAIFASRRPTGYWTDGRRANAAATRAVPAGLADRLLLPYERSDTATSTSVRGPRSSSRRAAGDLTEPASGRRSTTRCRSTCRKCFAVTGPRGGDFPLPRRRPTVAGAADLRRADARTAGSRCQRAGRGDRPTLTFGLFRPSTFGSKFYRGPILIPPFVPSS